MDKYPLRAEPLGLDRFRNMYWHLRGARAGRLFVTRVATVPSSAETAYDHAACLRALDPSVQLSQPQWGYYDTKEQLDALRAFLNGKGERERFLLERLNAAYRSILHDFRARAKAVGGGGGGIDNGGVATGVAPGRRRQRRAAAIAASKAVSKVPLCTRHEAYVNKLA